MKLTDRFVLTTMLIVMGAVALPGQTPRRTPFSISEPLEIPGTVLNPGEYVMRLVEIEPHRNVLEVFETVQLWSSDDTQLLSTLLTMPNYDLPATDKSPFAFFDRGGNQPKALRLWFAPGRKYAQEFVYPTAQAVELAKTVGRAVLSMPPELPGDAGKAAKMVTQPSHRASKAPIVPPETSAPPPDQSRARAQDNPAANTAALPKTGGYLPLLALIGLIALMSGLLLHALARRLEAK
jgi:hypothetical protein